MVVCLILMALGALYWYLNEGSAPFTSLRSMGNQCCWNDPRHRDSQDNSGRSLCSVLEVALSILTILATLLTSAATIPTKRAMGRSKVGGYSISISSKWVLVASTLLTTTATAFVPFLDGGSGMPKLYDGWFNEQVAKQASTAVGKAVSAGKTKIEVNFPPVPNLDEVKFGTALNQKFGTTVIAKDLQVVGGYKPGSDVSRNLVAFSNIYWAKKVASAVGGLGKNRVAAVLTAEPVSFDQIKSFGDVSRWGAINTPKSRREGRNGEAVICVNPGGEETWNRLISLHGSPNAPFIILNNAYSTTYDLGNQCGFEEAYYLKRISKGWVFRSFPGPWVAYLEKPDGTVEVLETYKTKPLLRDVSTLVREESFRRYAIGNDRWTPGFGQRL